jgi:hypothetical protein
MKNCIQNSNGKFHTKFKVELFDSSQATGKPSLFPSTPVACASNIVI